MSMPSFSVYAVDTDTMRHIAKWSGRFLLVRHKMPYPPTPTGRLGISWALGTEKLVPYAGTDAYRNKSHSAPLIK